MAARSYFPPWAPTPGVGGMSMHIEVQLDNPTIFLVRDLSRPDSDALLLTLDIMCALDISPAFEIEIRVDVSDLRGLRSEPVAGDGPVPLNEEGRPLHLVVRPVSHGDYLRPFSLNAVLLLCWESPRGPARTVLHVGTAHEISLRAGYAAAMCISCMRRPCDVCLCPWARRRYQDVFLLNEALGSFFGAPAPPPAASVDEPLAAIAAAAAERAADAATARAAAAAERAADPTVVRLTTLSIAAVLPSVNLSVVNDISGIDLPLVRLRLAKINAVIGAANVWRGADAVVRDGGDVDEMTVVASLSIAAEYYDAANAVWEPLIEKWGLEAQYEQPEQRRAARDAYGRHVVSRTVAGDAESTAHEAERTAALAGDSVAVDGVETVDVLEAQRSASGGAGAGAVAGGGGGARAAGTGIDIDEYRADSFASLRAKRPLDINVTPAFLNNLLESLALLNRAGSKGASDKAGGYVYLRNDCEFTVEIMTEVRARNSSLISGAHERKITRTPSARGSVASVSRRASALTLGMGTPRRESSARSLHSDGASGGGGGGGVADAVRALGGGGDAILENGPCPAYAATLQAPAEATGGASFCTEVFASPVAEALAEVPHGFAGPAWAGVLLAGAVLVYKRHRHVWRRRWAVLYGGTLYLNKARPHPQKEPAPGDGSGARKRSGVGAAVAPGAPSHDAPHEVSFSTGGVAAGYGTRGGGGGGGGGGTAKAKHSWLRVGGGDTLELVDMEAMPAPPDTHRGPAPTPYVMELRLADGAGAVAGAYVAALCTTTEDDYRTWLRVLRAVCGAGSRGSARYEMLHRDTEAAMRASAAAGRGRFADIAAAAAAAAAGGARRISTGDGETRGYRGRVGRPPAGSRAADFSDSEDDNDDVYGVSFGGGGGGDDDSGAETYSLQMPPIVGAARVLASQHRVDSALARTVDELEDTPRLEDSAPGFMAAAAGAMTSERINRVTDHRRRSTQHALRAAGDLDGAMIAALAANAAAMSVGGGGGGGGSGDLARGVAVRRASAFFAGNDPVRPWESRQTRIVSATDDSTGVAVDAPSIRVTLGESNEEVLVPVDKTSVAVHHFRGRVPRVHAALAAEMSALIDPAGTAAPLLPPPPRAPPRGRVPGVPAAHMEGDEEEGAGGGAGADAGDDARWSIVTQVLFDAGFKTLVLRTDVSVVNYTACPVRVVFDDAAGRHVTVRDLGPGEEVFAPVCVATDGAFHLQPLVVGDGDLTGAGASNYERSAAIPLGRSARAAAAAAFAASLAPPAPLRRGGSGGAADRAPPPPCRLGYTVTVECPPSAAAGGGRSAAASAFVCSAYFRPPGFSAGDDPYTTCICLLPMVRLVNLLPLRMQYCLRSTDAPAFDPAARRPGGDAAIVATGLLEPAQSADVLLTTMGADGVRARSRDRLDLFVRVAQGRCEALGWSRAPVGGTAQVTGPGAMTDTLVLGPDDAETAPLLLHVDRVFSGPLQVCSRIVALAFLYARARAWRAAR